MMRPAAVGRAEGPQPWLPSLGPGPSTCRCSRARWTLLQPPTQGAPQGQAVQASDADTKASRLAGCRIRTCGLSPFPALQRQTGDEEVAKRPCKKP